MITTTMARSGSKKKLITSALYFLVCRSKGEGVRSYNRTWLAVELSEGEGKTVIPCDVLLLFLGGTNGEREYWRTQPMRNR